jgi:hypothetical protein
MSAIADYLASTKTTITMPTASTSANGIATATINANSSTPNRRFNGPADTVAGSDETGGDAYDSGSGAFPDGVIQLASGSR